MGSSVGGERIHHAICALPRVLPGDRGTGDAIHYGVPGSPIRLPPAHYGFLDMYCDEPGCDCRRVFLSVVSSRSKRIEAVVAWGWEDVEFYAKWMRSGGRDMALMLKGPALNMGSPETELAPVLLHLFSSVLLKDPSYVARIKRHYALFRDRIDGKRAGAAHSEKVGAATATQ